MGESTKQPTFEDLGLSEELCEACVKMGWTRPTPIQREAIPVALKGNDIIGLAETGSGKTGAFGLPILHSLLEAPQDYYSLILTPTRELAVQIKEQFDQLGAEIGLKCCAVVGGIDKVDQARSLMRGPHIIVATLGRLVDHIKHLKGFHNLLAKVKYLVMDEADRILNMDFEEEVDTVIRALSNERRTYLFSATITNKVQELQRAHLRNAVKVEVNTCFKIVDSLKQYMLPVPFIQKYLYLVHLIKEVSTKSVIVFCNTRHKTLSTSLILRQCGHRAIPLYGDMSQVRRLEALEKFKSQERSTLVATDVASRGLDIPCVDYVINLEVPSRSEDYIHRVGRTARAGRPGVAITMCSQFEIEDFLRIEQLIFQASEQMNRYPELKDVAKLESIVSAAEKAARREVKRIDELKRANSGGGQGSDDEDDTEGASRVRRRIKTPGQQSGGKPSKRKRR